MRGMYQLRIYIQTIMLRLFSNQLKECDTWYVSTSNIHTENYIKII